MTEHEAYVAFNLTDRMGSVRVAELVRSRGSVATAWEDFPAKTGRDGGAVDWRRELELAVKYGVTLVTPADAAYPRQLLESPGHPLCLYVKGDVAALAKPSVALVGTRRATAYGTDVAEAMARELAAAGWMVLSGLALGIDAAAHRGALAVGGVTVGVLGSALDRFYPEENRDLAREIVRKGGAVASEFPFGREPDRETFPIRNHVVAALARGVVAVEAPAKSGTLITTAIAAELGRTVMAVPARVDNRMSGGCLKLIRDGARLVRSAADVMEELSELIPRVSAARRGAAPEAPDVPSAPAEPSAPPPPPRRPAPLPERPEVTLEEAIVLRNLDEEGVSLDRLCDRTGFAPMKLNSLCMGLRLKGRLRYLPGNRVAPAPDLRG